MGRIRDSQKKIAAINDLSGFGRCSIAVELPIISAMKIQCCFVPTAVFSNHTGFKSFFLEDFTDKMRPYTDEWRKLELHFQGICTGFLGSPQQIAIVTDFLKDFKKPLLLSLFAVCLFFAIFPHILNLRVDLY